MITLRTTATGVAAKIFSFLSLPDGWEFGEGKAPSFVTAARSVAVANRMMASGFEKADAFAAADGSILVVGYLVDNCIEVYVYPSGKLAVAFEEADVEIEAHEDLSLQQAFEMIATGANRWRGSFGFYTLNTLIEKRTVSEAQPSRTLQEAGYRWLKQIASANIPSVIISAHSTPHPLPVTPQYSGEYRIQ
jgi:hypothetical protein